ncbi:GNAT family N-acetyltransferase [Streptomyces purpureus]|uniref:N-acetyltransferase domain-containing protein n=1 Tax=Streptomyces purpureus TaxID=1951 RepID=A0A918LTD6_9ACTN|nr:GNAT family N-acetyltransferase [Streptomyces purpureus]GGT46599.1 hypothetical protein GCM10014713_45790 [Streptomyces purpureus]
MGVNSGSGLASLERMPGYVFRPYRGPDDHGAMAAERLGCVEGDRVDARSVVQGVPTPAEIAEACATLDDPSENQLLAEHMAGVALCSIRRQDPTIGEVEELGVRAESRRLGLGRALLLEGLRCLREHGAETARLYTGTANPYRSYDLYESVGFRRQNEYVRYRKPIAV